MSKVKIQGNASGTGIFTVAAPATNTDRTITLPDEDLNLANVITASTGNFTQNISIARDGYPALKFRNAAGTDKAEIYVGTGVGDLNVVVNSQAAIAIDSSARVRMPYQPSAALGRSSGQFNSTSTIIWNVAHHNVGNHYNTSTGLFTCPVSGYYLVSIMVMTDATNTTLDIELQVNQATNQSLVPYQSGGATYNQVSGMTVISVSAGDTLSFKLNNGNIYGTGTNGRHSACLFRLLG